MWKPFKTKEEENKEDGEDKENENENEKDDENERADDLNEDTSPSSFSPFLRGKRTGKGGEGEESIEMV